MKNKTNRHPMMEFFFGVTESIKMYDPVFLVAQLNLQQVE